MKAEEAHESIHETAHAGGNGRRIAMLIAVLAALLAMAEMGAKNADQEALAANVEASNLWAFFQAKSIRQTTIRTAADELEVLVSAPATAPETRMLAEKRIAGWRAAADRYESEPSTNEGRKELAARAKAAESRRDRDYASAHMFELGSAAIQLAIVLASASVVSGVVWLSFVAGGFGLIGAILAMLGAFAPTLLHF